MYDCWANPVVHLLLLKRSKARLVLLVESSPIHRGKGLGLGLVLLGFEMLAKLVLGVERDVAVGAVELPRRRPVDVEAASFDGGGSRRSRGRLLTLDQVVQVAFALEVFFVMGLRDRGHLAQLTGRAGHYRAGIRLRRPAINIGKRFCSKWQCALHFSLIFMHEFEVSINQHLHCLWLMY